MANSEKKAWTKPEIRRFETPEALWAFYHHRGTAAERAKLLELVMQMHKPRKARVKRDPLRKAANG